MADPRDFIVPREKQLVTVHLHGGNTMEGNIFLEYYPEIARCLACNTCTKSCPQDIMVMDYVQAARRGDVVQAAT